MLFRSGLVATMCLAALSPALAQDTSAEPNYGTLRLSSGFSDDPRVVNVRSGGSIDAQRQVSDQCRGHISSAPDVRLHYDAGSLPLIISVASDSDTTLVVNGPDGSWYCDDDGGEEALNPSIRFGSPRSGRYEIWVGTYGESETRSAQVNISELRSR